jgi:hypothetical protein
MKATAVRRIARDRWVAIVLPCLAVLFLIPSSAQTIHRRSAKADVWLEPQISETELIRKLKLSQAMRPPKGARSCVVPDTEIANAAKFKCEELTDSPIKPTEDNEIVRVFSGPPLINYATIKQIEDFQSYPIATSKDNTETIQERAEEDVRFGLNVIRQTRFVPTSWVAHSAAIHQITTRLAKRGTLFGCEFSSEEGFEDGEKENDPKNKKREAPIESCYFFSLGGGEKRDVFLCEVTGNTTEDAPLRCQPFFIQTNSGAWIAVVDVLEIESKGSGEGIGPPTPDMTIALLTNKPDFPFFEKFAIALSAQPLSLTTQFGNAGRSITASSPQRKSQVIGGYNEWISLWADLNEECSETSQPDQYRSYRSVCVSFRGGLFVNKQRDSDITHWRAPGSEMIHLFQVAILENFRRELAKSCSHIDEVGNRIVCKF